MKYIYLFFLILVVNCTYNMGNLKEYSLEAPTNLENVGSARVTGEHCVWRIFTFRGWWSASISEATRNALLKAPGATGLKDAVISGHHESIIYACMEIEGMPVKESGVPTPPAKKGK